MAAYFASDIHLRLDAPERSARFARWVRSLTPDDSLTIVGDLCDFWFATRQIHLGMDGCEGLCALADFSHSGPLTILAGNHDARLFPEYARWFRARLVGDDCTEVVHGKRVWLAHGHRLGARPLYKEAMESRWFGRAFSHCPHRVASWLEFLNDSENERSREASDRKHLEIYRKRAAERAGQADVVILGHVHRVVREEEDAPRWYVLGNWHQRSSFLKIDEEGIHHVVEG